MVVGPLFRVVVNSFSVQDAGQHQTEIGSESVDSHRTTNIIYLQTDIFFVFQRVPYLLVYKTRVFLNFEVQKFGVRLIHGS